ncbi:MAG TPA: ACT domain-containing protein [Candidatus Deferrimicrobiaceae bacterium]|jgi:glycine cleavage system transcriptional repressor
MGFFSVSVVGRDRPGIVAGISRVLFELGCNVEDSSNTILSGQFAMLLVVGHPGMTSPEALDRAFDGIRASLGLMVAVHPVSAEDLSRDKEPKGTPHILSVYGSDRPGIVYRVTQALADRRVNVTDLKTQVVGAKDRPVYVMVIEADIPDDFDMKGLEAELESLRRELHVSISIRPIETLEL